MCLLGNGELVIADQEANSLWLLATLLFIVISSYIYLDVPLLKIILERTVPDVTLVTKSAAIIQICVWFASFILFLYLNERHDD